MSAPAPTPDGAKAAVARAGAAVSAVRSAHRYFQVVLLVFATSYLAALLALARFELLNPLFVWLICLLLAPMMFGVRSWQQRQQLAFTTASRVAFNAAGWSFVAWNAVLITSVAIALASVVPLLAGIAYIGGRR